MNQRKGEESTEPQEPWCYWKQEAPMRRAPRLQAKGGRCGGPPFSFSVTVRELPMSVTWRHGSPSCSSSWPRLAFETAGYLARRGRGVLQRVATCLRELGFARRGVPARRADPRNSVRRRNHARSHWRRERERRAPDCRRVPDRRQLHRAVRLLRGDERRRARTDIRKAGDRHPRQARGRALVARCRPRPRPLRDHVRVRVLLLHPEAARLSLAALGRPEPG